MFCSKEFAGQITWTAKYIPNMEIYDEIINKFFFPLLHFLFLQSNQSIVILPLINSG
jgi:hypothetical protein